MSGMSFLERLLDGAAVEWKPLGEVGIFARGKRFVRTDMVSEGVPCIHYGEMYTHYGISANNSKSFIDESLALKLRKANYGDVVIVAAGETVEDIGNGTAWLGESDVVIHDACFSYKSKLDPTFVSYFLRTRQFKEQIKRHISSSKISAINADGLSKAVIPIPCPDNPDRSLAIQAEIVRILDTFTELTTELTRELTLRKKQYEYYRDRLLTFEEGEVEWKTLGDENFFEVGSGGTPSKTKPEYWNDGNIPWLKSESCNNVVVYSANHFITELGLKKSSAKLLAEKTSLIALVGATIFKTAFLEFSATTNQNIASIKSKNSNAVNDKFVFYYITNMYEVLKSEMRNYGMLNLTTLRQFKIPIPPLAEQARIVSILDKFDTLTTSISEGLPREIALRQQQYEYYRDLLLSFSKADEEQ